jgi:hypothetical protein
VPPVVAWASIPLMRVRVKSGAEAANGDGAALAGVTVDRDARDTLDRLGQVQVGEVGDVLGDDDVNDVGVAPLRVDGRRSD